MQKFDRVRLVNVLLDILIQARPEDSSIGVCFLALAKVAESKFGDDMPEAGVLPIERHIIIPLWQHQLIQMHVQTNPIVFNRKSIFDFLIAVWRVLGDTITDKYLAPSTTDTSSKASAYGLSVPSYRLFQVLVAQEKRRLQSAS
jgi:hypothetical protein